MSILVTPRSRMRSSALQVQQISRLCAGIGLLLSFAAATGCGTLDPVSTAATASTSRIVISASFPTATVGTPYNATVTVSGGVAPYRFVTQGGPLPPGLTINPGSGSISGTPKKAGFFQFNLVVADRSRHAVGLKIVRIPVQECDA